MSSDMVRWRVISVGHELLAAFLNGHGRTVASTNVPPDLRVLGVVEQTRQPGCTHFLCESASWDPVPSWEPIPEFGAYYQSGPIWDPKL